MQNITKIMELYTAYFNRAADKEGVDYWANEMNINAWTLDDVANSFAQQTEYAALYAGKTNSEIVELVYTNVLNREADADGAAYWKDELDSGAVIVSQFIQAVVNAATEIVNGVYKHPTDAAIVNNKTIVSQYAYDTNSNSTDISLAEVTEDKASQEPAKSQIDAANHVLDFTGVLNGQFYAGASTSEDSKNHFGNALANDTTLSVNEIIVFNSNTLGFDLDDTWVRLTSNKLSAAIQDANTGAANFGGINKDTLNLHTLDQINTEIATETGVTNSTLVGDTVKNIVMIENNLNLGEYKLFELTGIVGDTSEFTSATLLGIRDFGETQTFTDDKYIIIA